MILAIDTSGAITVGVVDSAGTVLAQRSVYEPRHHAELLADFVQQVLNEAGVERPNRIVVGTGPGPFTGLRVGLATARTLAFAWQVPVSGVCSLDAIAAGSSGGVTVVTDARRREVYWARYVNGVRVEGPAVAAPSEVPVDGVTLGRGVELYPDVFTAGSVVDVSVAGLVQAEQQSGSSDTEPLYLRRPDVHGVPGA